MKEYFPSKPGHPINIPDEIVFKGKLKCLHFCNNYSESLILLHLLINANLAFSQYAKKRYYIHGFILRNGTEASHLDVTYTWL